MKWFQDMEIRFLFYSLTSFATIEDYFQIKYMNASFFSTNKLECRFYLTDEGIEVQAPDAHTALPALPSRVVTRTELKCLPSRTIR